MERGENLSHESMNDIVINIIITTRRKQQTFGHSSYIKRTNFFLVQKSKFSKNTTIQRTQPYKGPKQWICLSSKMVFFDRTSTQMLSMIGAVYGVFIYSISFSLEMWFIVTSPVLPASIAGNQQFNPMGDTFRDQEEALIASVPLLAFVLAALYFVTVMVSLLLILGIIIRSMMCVLTWIITIVLLLLPEVSLVIFMTVYTWVCQVNTFVFTFIFSTIDFKHVTLT